MRSGLPMIIQIDPWDMVTERIKVLRRKSASYSRMGINRRISNGSMSICIDRALPGVRLISCFSISDLSIWWIVGGDDLKKRCRSASAGDWPNITE